MKRMKNALAGEVAYIRKRNQGQNSCKERKR